MTDIICLEILEEILNEEPFEKIESILNDFYNNHHNTKHLSIGTLMGILKMRMENKSLQKVGEHYGKSRERIRQIEYKIIGICRNYFKNLSRIEGLKIEE